MVTIGDVFSVIAVLAFLGFAMWASIMTGALLFQSKAESARTEFQLAPLKGLAVGALVSLLLIFASIITFNIPLPFAKILGSLVLSLLLALAVIGSSGVALVVRDRISVLDPGSSRYSALTRSAAILVASAFVPVVGWFLLAPAMFLVAVGCAFRAAIRKTSVVGSREF